MIDGLTLHVIGQPVPQGSMRAFNTPAGPRIVQGATNAKRKELAAWRDLIAVQAHIGMCGGPLFEGPVYVRAAFWLRPPANTPKTIRTWPCKGRSLDLDKLVRSVLDALTGVVFADDAQVTSLSADKDWMIWRPGPGPHYGEPGLDLLVSMR